MKSVFSLLVPAISLTAQVYVPPKPGPAAGAPVDIAPPASQQDAKSPFGEEVPILDPSAETITVAGVTIPLGDSRVIKARFEKYLNEPPEDSEAAEDYRATIDKILDLISPQRLADLTGEKGSGPSLADAFKLLPQAASYPGDARVSSSLAEAIYTAMLAKQDGTNLRLFNQKLEEERGKIGMKADEIARNERANKLGKETKVTKDLKGQTQTEETLTPGVGEQSLRYAEHVRRLAEIEALRKVNMARTEVSLMSSKAQYQAAMLQWFLQRRFQHVLMASRFYNQIWKDGDRVLKLEEGSDVARLFSESLGTTPTVSALDSLASEAIRDSEKAVEAFNYLLDQGEIHTASQRLMEAFALGEYLEPVATLPLERKRKVQGYIRDLNLLYGAMQARDYTRGKDLVASLKAQASDFPAAKADGAIAGYTLASDLAIEEAKAHLLAKENEKASESIKQAATIWPTNPKLQEFSSMVGSTSELVSSRNSFDRLLEERNYREIYKRAREGEFILAVRGDKERTDALNQITDNLMKIDGSIAKAQEFSKIGADYAAYEQLAKVREEFPDDPQLGREIELLAPRVADFTKAIDDAHKLRDRREPQLASAMAHYLKARSIYPNSELADAGINELMEEILPEG